MVSRATRYNDYSVVSQHLGLLPARAARTLARAVRRDLASHVLCAGAKQTLQLGARLSKMRTR
eukprot:CAMPEP_0185396820 /NCGR_PEP_ID=MMETSP1364-20130426/85462_1 /TAXON_ID=38817 /ORGANISM="Gephyrocapsa oceanica, Strain RCC1303" /LENGTH=62 /DNA_ID=CAMNT_0027999031 /DNA_START=273 /DNA_END=461 /DNA_ORIENTATION=+